MYFVLSDSGWVLLVKDAQMSGTVVIPSAPTSVSGNFTAFKAVYKSGYITCSVAGCSDPLTCKGWQLCNGGAAAGYFSFELKQNNAYLFQQKVNYYTLPVGCANPSTPLGDIVCNASSPVTVNVNDILTPTWLEPSTATSTGDNSGTLTLDLYGYRSGGSILSAVTDLQSQLAGVKGLHISLYFALRLCTLLNVFFSELLCILTRICTHT
jgi:hypothetical protein